MIFGILFLFIIVQRLYELRIAKRNETEMIRRGAREYAPEHYKWIVVLHFSFFISLVIEAYLNGFTLSDLFPLFFMIFICLQALRIWTIRSLGMFWNTKIIILPMADVVKNGPFRYMRHPNYVVVSLELLIIPMMFNAFATAVLFSIFNSLLLRFVRIPAEEKALSQNLDYERQFAKIPRFFPKETK